MKPDASDNRAMPVPASGWCSDVINPASSNGTADAITSIF
jgi:hypothetical protein